MTRIFCLGALLVVLATVPISATSTIRIELDGLEVLTSVDSVPRMMSGRTLVPLRALAEALGGQVDYDDGTRTAIIYHGITTIGFPLDKKRMYIDEQEIILDVAAQALNGRTFIPARYLAEAVGAAVDWNEQTQTVIVRTPAQERKLSASYDSASAIQFQAYGEYIHRAMPRWTNLQLTNNVITLKPTLPPGYEIVASDWAPSRGVHLSLQVFCDDMRILRPLLEGDRAGRESLAQEIVDFALALGFSGVNLDLESINLSRLQDSLTEFVAILADKCREQQLHLSAHVPAKTSGQDHGAYNYQTLSPHLDEVIVMAHDFVIASDNPGPHAPLWWVEQVLRFALREGIPKEKLVLNISLHGLNWRKEVSERAIIQELARFTEEWLVERGLEAIPYNEAQGMGYVEYTSPDAGQRILWTETTESIAAKVALVEKYNLLGVSFWRLGYAHPGLFEPSGPFTGFRVP